MNKIFKVIWNQATQSWVAVSELGKAQGKTKSIKSSSISASIVNLSKLAFALGSVLGSIDAMAAYTSSANARATGAGAIAIIDNFSGTSATAAYNETIAIGNQSYAGAENGLRDLQEDGSYAITRNGSEFFSGESALVPAIAIGSGTTANASNSIAIGTIATAAGNRAVSIGAGAYAEGSRTIALGWATEATGERALSIGSLANASGNYSLAIGAALGTGRVVSDSSLASGDYSNAIGAAAKATADNTTAIGTQTNATAVNATTIGTQSNATAVNATAIGTQANATEVNAAAVGTLANASGNASLALGNSSVSSNDSSIAVGSQSTANATNATAIGKLANATGANTIAMGSGSNANGTAATAIGMTANASAGNSVAIGTNSSVTTNGVSGVAIGTNSVSSAQGATALGYNTNASANHTLALGENSSASGIDSISIGHDSNATNTNSISIGYESTVSGADSASVGSHNTVAQNQTYVLGSYVTTTQENSVVLGLQSTDRAATTESSATVNGVTYGTFAGQGRSGNGVVSVGGVGSERQIINVAAGNVSENSTDAINGSQLYMVMQQVSKGLTEVTSADNSVTITTLTNSTTGATIYDLSVNSTNSSSDIQYYSVNSTVSGNQNNDGATGVDAMAAGPNATASGESATAVGDSSSASSLMATAIGVESSSSGIASTALGVLANASADGANAMGFQANATNNNTVAVGTSSTASGAESTAIGYNATASAQNSSAFGSDATASGVSSLAMGVGATASADSAVAIGNDSNATAQSAVAIGESSNATGNYSTAVGDTSTASGSRSSAFGIDSKAIGNASLAMGNTSNASGDSAIAIGSLSNANVTNATAIGTGANASIENSVALGSGATTSAAVATNSATVNGITYSGFAGNSPVSVVSVGSVGAERQIQNVAAGQITATSTDAINGSQLYMVANNLTDAINIANNTANVANTTANVANETVNKGWNITTAQTGTGTATGTTDENIQMGETVTVIAGDNINISQAVNNITIATSMTPTFTNVTTTNFTVQNGGTVDMGGNVVTNVANGTNATDAVNLSQLNSSTAAAKTELINGNTTTVNSSTGTDGQTVYTVEVNTSPVTVNSTTGVAETNANSTAANNSFATVGDVVNVVNNAFWTVQGNSTEVNKVTAGDVVNFVDGTGTTAQVTANGSDATNVTFNVKTSTLTVNNGTVTADTTGDTFATAENVAKAITDSELTSNVTAGDSNVVVTNVTQGNNTEFLVSLAKNLNLTDAGSVTIGNTTLNNNGLTITNGPSITQNGINAGDKVITNVAAGVNGTDAVNVNQLTDNITNVTNNITNISTEVAKGWNITTSASAGSVSGTSLEQISMGETVTMDAGKNINITQANNTITIATTDTPTFTNVTVGDTSISSDGLTINNGPSITKDGVNAGDKVITNVSTGVNGTDAVNVDQLNNVTAAAKTELANGNTTTVNSTTGANGQTVYTVEVNKSPLTVNSTTGVAETSADDATANNSFATVSDVVSTLNNVSWTVQGNGTDADKVTAGNKVNFVNGNGTTANVTSDGNVTNVTFNVNTTTMAFNSTTGTIEVGDNSSFATAGDVAKAIADSELTSSVVSGNDNLVVTNTTTGNNTEYKVTLSNNLNLTDTGSVTIGNTTLNNDGLTITNGPSVTQNGISAGDKVITNVAAGVNGTDAVNLDQLNTSTAAAKTELANGSTTTVNSSTGANGQTVYTVEVNKSPLTVNSTTGVAETSADDTAANNSFATVGDVVNALNNVSWTVQGNGTDADQVTAGNKVNFVNGNGTTANVTSDGNVTNVTFNVNTTNASVTDGKAAVGNGDSFLNATTVADLVNNVSWSVNASAVDGSNGVSSYVANANSSISAGDTVNYQAGQNIVIGGEGNNITIATNPNSTFDSVAVNNQVTVGNVTIASNGTISGVADGDISPTSTQAINGSQLYAANQNIANYLGGNSTVDSAGNVTAPSYVITSTNGTTTTVNNVGDAIDSLNQEVTKPLTFAGDTGASSERTLGSTVTVKGGVSDESKLSDNNIGVVSDGNGTLTVKLAKDISVDSVTAQTVTADTVKAGDTTINSDGVSIQGGPSVTKSGIDAAGNKVTNVKAGEADTDAVNVSQLKAATGGLNNRINKVNKELRAGIAGANAAAGLPQVYVPGKSMVAAAAGTYRGESALAVGYSRASDNGKVILKLQGNANTRGDVGGSVGVGYQW